MGGIKGDRRGIGNHSTFGSEHSNTIIVLRVSKQHNSPSFGNTVPRESANAKKLNKRTNAHTHTISKKDKCYRNHIKSATFNNEHKNENVAAHCSCIALIRPNSMTLKTVTPDPGRLVLKGDQILVSIALYVHSQIFGYMYIHSNFFHFTSLHFHT